MLFRKFSIFFIIFLSLSGLFGQVQSAAKSKKLNFAMEWAIPLKKTLVNVNRREQAGVTVFGKDILVATRAGELHLFGSNGELKLTAVFDGEFVVAPTAVDETHALAAMSNSVFMLELTTEKKGRRTKYGWKVLWHIEGKASVAASPVIYDDRLVLVQFHDSSIYAVDKTTGEIRTMYSDYENSEDLSVIRLAAPVVIDDKIVYGFSDGTIIFFMLRTGEKDDLIPYYKFKTSNTFKRFDKRDFFDVLSFVPMEDTILFSVGEYGGMIADGKPVKLENMEDQQLIKYKNGYAGYGKRGIFLFDENGKFVSQPFKSMNYVTNLAVTEDYAVAFTSGEGPMLGDSDGFVRVLSPDFSEIYASVMFPNGVSGNVACVENSFYFISDMGILYKFKVLK